MQEDPVGKFTIIIGQDTILQKRKLSSIDKKYISGDDGYENVRPDHES